uniref:DUF294 nucleotidyltransferase-like domain-containing protein n=1 Tax=Roseihalotalea indica TaxID=2867963 RepID=A0AA49JII1_9BACT|nr:DUF294 nucleotidyltransferase-like domain-containing protein [Tunicatimonas sp. TK19036]
MPIIDKPIERNSELSEAQEEDLLDMVELQHEIDALAYQQDTNQRKIGSLEYRPVVSCTSRTPIFQAARIMAEQNISCLFVKDEQQHIVGYVTDITLRNHVVAKKQNVDLPVEQVMNRQLVVIDEEASITEALLLMFRTHTRFLLIKADGNYRGMISRGRLLSERGQSPFVFIQSVKLAVSTDELKEKWAQMPEVINQLLHSGIKAEIVNQVVTTVSDTIAQKVIEGVIAEMGEPPAKFVFMVLGSEGRKEQTLKTDQDNAIIYEDKANEQRERVRQYFLAFADKVSERLDYIGFSYCTGGFMAKNPKWTHSLSHWKRNYEQWINESMPEAVMNIATFFDCRYLYGDKHIMDELRIFLDEQLQRPLNRFLYQMANNALQYEPPLTFFKSIRTFTKNSQKVFNLKKAMTPIVDLVRVYALKNRIFKTNTGERLEALRDEGIFTEREYQELMQAYYYLMSMRLKKQAMQIIQDRTAPDNYLEPKSLTSIEQVTLKEIFKTIEKFQLKIKVAFTHTLF